MKALAPKRRRLESGDAAATRPADASVFPTGLWQRVALSLPAIFSRTSERNRALCASLIPTGVAIACGELPQTQRGHNEANRILGSGASTTDADDGQAHSGADTIGETEGDCSMRFTPPVITVALTRFMDVPHERVRSVAGLMSAPVVHRRGIMADYCEDDFPGRKAWKDDPTVTRVHCGTPMRLLSKDGLMARIRMDTREVPTDTEEIQTMVDRGGSKVQVQGCDGREGKGKGTEKIQKSMDSGTGSAAGVVLEKEPAGAADKARRGGVNVKRKRPILWKGYDEMKLTIELMPIGKGRRVTYILRCFSRESNSRESNSRESNSGESGEKIPSGGSSNCAHNDQTTVRSPSENLGVRARRYLEIEVFLSRGAPTEHNEEYIEKGTPSSQMSLLGKGLFVLDPKAHIVFFRKMLSLSKEQLVSWLERVNTERMNRRRARTHNSLGNKDALSNIRPTQMHRYVEMMRNGVARSTGLGASQPRPYTRILEIFHNSSDRRKVWEQLMGAE